VRLGAAVDGDVRRVARDGLVADVTDRALDAAEGVEPLAARADPVGGVAERGARLLLGLALLLGAGLLAADLKHAATPS
jgi:hypothetical protein